MRPRWHQETRPRRTLRLALGSAVAFLAAAALDAAVAEAKVRVAVPDFKIDGEGTPALALQLQDGFVLGLVRAGIQVLDPVDVGRKLEATPELNGCDSSACLKNLGRILGVGYLVRVKVEVAGNSYKMVARLFSTEGEAPAALPISTKSRSCDVCTVAEARDYMLRMADALRPEMQDTSPAPLAPTQAPPAPPPSLVPPLVLAMGGLLAMGLGFALLGSMPDCASTSLPSACNDYRLRSAVAGGLVGAGAAITVMGTVVTVSRATSGGGPTPATATTVALTMPF